MRIKWASDMKAQALAWAAADAEVRAWFARDRNRPEADFDTLAPLAQQAWRDAYVRWKAQRCTHCGGTGLEP